MHALFHCCGMDDLWAAEPFSVPRLLSISSFWTGFEMLHSTLNSELLPLVAIVLKIHGRVSKCRHLVQRGCPHLI